MNAQIHGTCDPAFQPLADAFEANFRERNELGASACLTVEGETVVDLWGGHKDAARTEQWEQDTICVVYSNTKAATALCAHILIDRGELALDEKVSSYWPEFAQAGKEDATVSMLLDHSVGLPAFRVALESGANTDWQRMADLLAAQEPFWPPGSRNGYHMTSFGWLVGEVVRRVSGLSLGAFFKREIADPLGLDYHIGLPLSEERRLATIELYRPTPDDPRTAFVDALMDDPRSIQFLSLFNTGGAKVNSREGHGAELGGHGGIANARAMAGMFTPLANGGGDLVSAERVAAMSIPAAESDCDANLLIPTRFSHGFMLSMDNRATHPMEGHSAILGPTAFGHVGLGGSLSFADPEKRMAFGYAMNRHGGGLLLNERGQSLVDAAYSALDR